MAGSKHTLQKVLISISVVAIVLGSLKVAPVQAAGMHPTQTTRNPGPSCIQPATAEERALCSEMEARILAVTVQIELQAQFYLQGNRIVKETHSHATIIAGRYLVTHNHYQFPITKTAADGEEGYLRISLRQANGALILDHAPLSAFTIAHTDAQTLVLDFSEAHRNGLFTGLGLPSAEVTGGFETRLEPGDELAHIDWDGRVPHVDWVRVERLGLSLDVPQIEVDNFVRAGSSGGGLFWNGRHIGNTWARNIELDTATEAVTRRFTIVALNSPALVRLVR